MGPFFKRKKPADNPASIPTIEPDLPKWIWCLVANVREYPVDDFFNVVEKKRRGTKHFGPGTRVFVYPVQWGDGWERMVVVGRKKGSRRLIRKIVDGDMLESRSLAARGGIFVAVPQLDLDPLVAGDDAADIRILQGAWQTRYAPCTVQSDGQRGADMDVLIAEARAAQCRYAVRQHVSVKRSRDEADTVRVVLETSVYDAQGTFITVVSKSTTDRRMTPLEAVAYLQFATLRDLDTVFVTQNT